MMPALLSGPIGRVAILLSTYNGARFLPAQLESFLAQTYKDWVLHWRDDGSTDETVSIMRAFAAKIGAERCIESRSSGSHLGAAASFLTLLQENASVSAIAFADQDDVWLPEKLATAVNMLGDVGDTPALYCARQYLVDEALCNTRLSARHGSKSGFPACLAQNIANGNTVVMNRAAAVLVAASNGPAGTVHDWWSYIVVSACGGRILFDDQPQVLYRLHKHNLIGRARPLPARALAALRRGRLVYITMMRRHTEALTLLSVRLAPEARRDLWLIRAGLHGGIFARLRALSCPRFRRRTLLENLLFRYWFLTSSAAQPDALPSWQSAEPAPVGKLLPR